MGGGIRSRIWLDSISQSVCNLAVPPDAEVSAQPFRVELYDGPSH